MAYKPTRFKVPDPPEEQAPFVIPYIGGVNLRDEQSQIQDYQSPYNDSDGRPGTINQVSDGARGTKKRKGFTRVNTVSQGPGPIHGVWNYVKTDGTAVTLVHYGTRIYVETGI